MLLTIKNNVSEIDKMCDSVKAFCDQNNISEQKYHDLILILDEMVSNIINYAYPDGGEHEFFLQILIEDPTICIVITDKGIPFDPLSRADPDTDLALEEREIGGLGIFLVKQLSRRVEYRREDGCNKLTIHVSAKCIEEKTDELGS